MRTIEWRSGTVVTIDQAKLPNKVVFLEMMDCYQVASVIMDMKIRGAPLIGVAAAYGLALTAHHSKAEKREELMKEIEESAEVLRRTRPTAMNLFWAVDRIIKKARETPGSAKAMAKAIIDEAQSMADEDIQVNRKIGEYGSALIKDGDTVGTICNAGWLATAGVYGTALGVIKMAHEQGKRISVIALETRPVLQGARLTAFELRQDGVEVKVIADGMIGYCFHINMIDKFICGADRVILSSGGHVVNKVGTYTVAVVAKHHGVPFYVAAPLSTFDFESGLGDIVIEERDSKEITHIMGHRIVPHGVSVLNPAFDITPPEFISAIITERGIIHPPLRENANKMI